MLIEPANFINPEWPAPPNVKAISTTREHPQGASQDEYQSFNLGLNCSDNPVHVEANRQLLRQTVPTEPLWLHQVHGVSVIKYQNHLVGTTPAADGCFSTSKHQACVVMTADCLPILLCDTEGQFVAAVHAGWRGLYEGIIQTAVDRFIAEQLASVNQLLAWMGPAISQTYYQVDTAFRGRFVALDPYYMSVFKKDDQAWYADLYAVASYQLKTAGIEMIYGGGYCTGSGSKHFYSHRREHGKTGRQASLIWLD